MLCCLCITEADRTEGSALFLHPLLYPQSCTALRHLTFPWKSQGPKANTQTTVPRNVTLWRRNSQRPGREVPRGEHAPCTRRSQYPLPGERGGLAQRCFGEQGQLLGPAPHPGVPDRGRQGPNAGPGPQSGPRAPGRAPKPPGPVPKSWLQARGAAPGAGFESQPPAQGRGEGRGAEGTARARAREHVVRRGDEWPESSKLPPLSPARPLAPPRPMVAEEGTPSDQWKVPRAWPRRV